MKKFISRITLLVLFGCNPPSSEKTEEGKPFHKIVYLDKYFTEFLNSIKTDTANRDKIYAQKITDALMRDYFDKAEYALLAYESFSRPIRDTSGMGQYISELNANKVQIDSIITGAYLKCNQFLKNDSVTFYVLPSNAHLKEIIKEMGGVMALTAGSKQIVFNIDFNVSEWKENLEYSVAHEFHHSYWTNENYNEKDQWTLLDYLVFEGKADSYAHFLYPNVKAPWTEALDEKLKIELWANIRPQLNSEDSQLLFDVMFGSKLYPKWGGYTLGYDIVQAALKNHPELPKINWTNLEAEKIYELSGYKYPVLVY